MSIFNSELKSLKLLHRGKVRDLYAVDEARLLIVQTDRISAFDVVLPTPIPGKGQVLTSMSLFWFKRLSHIIPNHLLDVDPVSCVTPAERDQVAGRAMVVRRLKPLMIEAIVRGYVAGSGWKDYQKTGAICGIPLPAGLKEADKLPTAIFTPSTKAPVGTHDENIPFAEAERIIGAQRAGQVRDSAIALYTEAADYARGHGILIADTKFEFGTDADGRLYVMDEMLTPDSSRFWPADQYRTGISPPSYDKQFVRDYLETLDWNKQAPGPKLPAAVIDGTAAKYAEALKRLAGIVLD